MVTYTKGKTEIPLRKRGRVKTILDIDLGNMVEIFILPGSISANDIIVKFKDGKIPRTRARQPSHIHWAVDLLIKKDNEPRLVDEFLKKILDRWNSIKPLPNRNHNTLMQNLILSQNSGITSGFSILEHHGFFSISFLTHLMELLMIQEKTNYTAAYMFKDVVAKVLEHKDLYSIISKASYSGR